MLTDEVSSGQMLQAAGLIVSSVRLQFVLKLKRWAGDCIKDTKSHVLDVFLFPLL